jgi:hypothetical protein
MRMLLIQHDIDLEDELFHFPSASDSDLRLASPYRDAALHNSLISSLDLAYSELLS